VLEGDKVLLPPSALQSIVGSMPGHASLPEPMLFRLTHTPPAVPSPAGDAADGDAPGPVLDVRTAAEFAERHLRGAAHIPLAELSARLYELPPMHSAPLRLFGDSSQLAAAQEILEGRGWKVDEPLLDSGSDAAWEAGPTESGPRASRIWQPNEFLLEVWPKVTAALELTAAQESSSVKRKKVAVDVGCGSGRDLVWLALQLGPEWDVVGLDNHKAALQRARTLAESAGVADRVFCVDVDLRKNVHFRMSEMKADLVHGCRFLCRELFPEIRDDVLIPGGVFVWSHFIEGCEQYAPPLRPSRQLAIGELHECFVRGGDYLQLHDEEGQMITRTELVPATFFAAQKK